MKKKISSNEKWRWSKRGLKQLTGKKRYRRGKRVSAEKGERERETSRWEKKQE